LTRLQASIKKTHSYSRHPFLQVEIHGAAVVDEVRGYM